MEGMSMTRYFLCIFAVFFSVHFSGFEATAQSARQFYSNGRPGGEGKWERDEKAKGHKIWWHFKVNKNDKKYQRHIAYAFDNQPSRVYYYNPGTKKFWGRCEIPSDGSGGAGYSELKSEDRKEKLSLVAESSFPKPGGMPMLKATDEAGKARLAEDGATMEPPPPLPVRVSKEGVALDPPPSPAL